MNIKNSLVSRLTEFFHMNSKKSTNSLKKLVENKRKSIEREEQGRFDFFEDLSWYRPSRSLNILIFLGLIGISVLSHYLLKFVVGKIDFPTLTFFSTQAPLIAIHAGIGTIILALLIFVAESKRSSDNPFTARVLLKEAKLYPLAVAEVTVFIGYAMGISPFASIAPVILIGFATIYSLHNIIKLLLNEYLFHQKQQKVFEDRAKNSIDLAVEERLGNNMLRALLGDAETDGREENKKNSGGSSKREGQVEANEEIQLVKRVYLPRNEDKFYWFSCNQTGTIVDINIRALKAFSDNVEEFANEHGYCWSNAGIKPEGEGTEWKPKIIEEGKETKELQVLRDRYLLTNLYDEITDNNKGVLCIKEELLRESEVKELRKLVDPIFTLKESPTFEKEMRAELSDIKDFTLSAIEVGKTGRLKRMKDFYLNYTKTFLKCLEPLLEGGFSFSQAREERRNLGGGWEPVRWISDDIQDIYEKGKRAKSRSVLSIIIDFPIAITRQAIQYSDHYLFQEFISYAKFIYKDAQERSGVQKSFMSDKAWRKLKDIVEFLITPKLNRDSINVSKKKDLKNYVIYIFKTWQELLKIAIKEDNMDDFDNMLSHFARWFQHFQPSSSTQNAVTIQYKLDNKELDSKTKEELKTQLKTQKALEKIEEEIAERKNQMLFGLTSWVLDEVLKKDEYDQFKRYLDKLMNYLPSDISRLTELYADVSNHKVISFWDWVNWTLPKDGEVHFINFRSKLRWLYVVKSLSILEPPFEENIEELELPYEHDFAIEAKEEGDLRKLVDKIEDNPDKWNKVLSKDAFVRTEYFKKFLDKVREKYLVEEKKKKRESGISEEKVYNFRENFVKGFEDTGNLRSILKEDFNLFLDKSDKKVKQVNRKRFGRRIVSDKGAFIDNDHTTHLDWGKDHGKQMAWSEDKYILGKIADAAEKISGKAFQDMLGEFDQLEELFILASSSIVYNKFLDTEKFTPEWSLDKNSLYRSNSFKGFYVFNDMEIPVFGADFSDLGCEIIAINAENFGDLVQYSPLLNEENPEFVKSYFYINVRAYSQNPTLLKETLDNPPDWLEEKGNREDQKQYLEENVLIEIFEKFELKKNDIFEGYKLRLNESK